jgi:putative DNA primase/helicase
MKLSDEERRKITAALQPDRRIVVTNLAGIEPVQLRFLWWPYLPLGKVVIVAGAPGHGKSQLTALMAAMATRASFVPSDVLEPSRVLIMSAEDDLADTIVPRLLAVNADMSKVDTINVRTDYADGLTAEGMIRIPGDVPSVYAYVKRFPDTRLVVLDPVVSFFGREHSSTSNQDVRDALDPLVAIAKAHAITVVVILHLNKAESKDFTARVAESHGFQALARCVLALGPDPDDTDGERGSKKVLAVTKANLAGAGNHALRCEVHSAMVYDNAGHPIATSELALIGKADIAADDLLMSSADRSARVEAAEWLDDFVGDGWTRVGDLRKAALSDGGHHWRTIERIRQAGGYQRAKQPGVPHGPWWVAKSTTTTPIPLTGDLGGVGDLTGVTTPQDRQDGPYPVLGEATFPNDANGAKPAKSAKNVTDLDAWRRFEQRRLGERDDDDEDPGA